MLLTKRLMLRPFWDDDFARFAAINADPDVMAFFPKPLNRQESDALIARIMVHFARHGFGMWAVEAPGGVSPLIGMVGLSVVPNDLPCAPAVEVGWRLGKEWWGRGYATEAARAAIADGVERCGLKEFVSFTTEINAPSRAVMERLGMTRDAAEDFDHPRVPEGDALRRHVLYRLRIEGDGHAIR
jgi:RimJ/RimL family protein N-acetyltransferase